MSNYKEALNTIIKIKPHLKGMGGSLGIPELGNTCKEHLDTIIRALKIADSGFEEKYWKLLDSWADLKIKNGVLLENKLTNIRNAELDTAERLAKMFEHYGHERAAKDIREEILKW